MKRILLFLALTAGVQLVLPFVLSAQIAITDAHIPAKKAWRKADDGFWERRNVLSVGIANISGNGFDMGFAPLTIAYDHRTKSGITVGGILQRAHNFFTTSTDSYEVSDASFFAMARVGYDLKIARRLRLRFGLGAGVGVHRIYDVSNGMCNDHCQPLPDFPHTKAMPHLLADVYWVWRVGRNLELMFAPLVFSPSQFIFWPWDDDHYPGGYYGYNIMPLRLGVRF